jgi:hypothetical protein
MGVADPSQIEVVEAYSTDVSRPERHDGTPGLSAFPNPFSDRVVLEVVLPTSGFVTLDVFSIDGRRVRRLLSRSAPAGKTRIEWDAGSAWGHPVSAGMYVVRLSVAGYQVFRKVARV